MKRSIERFLTTHTGSLPRPDDLIRMMFAQEEGVPVNQAALAARIRSAVTEVVRQQAEAGIDVINDGEVSKPSYATYIKDRLRGFGGTSQSLQYQDLLDFPELAKRVFSDPGRSRRRTPACNGPISVGDTQAVQRDVALLASHRCGINRTTRPDAGCSQTCKGGSYDTVHRSRQIVLDIASNGAFAVVGSLAGGSSGDNDSISLIDLTAKPPRVVDTIGVLGPTAEGLKISPDSSVMPSKGEEIGRGLGGGVAVWGHLLWQSCREIRQQFCRRFGAIEEALDMGLRPLQRFFHENALDRPLTQVKG